MSQHLCPVVKNLLDNVSVVSTKWGLFVLWMHDSNIDTRFHGATDRMGDSLREFGLTNDTGTIVHLFFRITYIHGLRILKMGDGRTNMKKLNRNKGS